MTELEMVKNKFFRDRNILKNQIDQIRENKKIVFTNGCFDILHAGHISYLSKAKDAGDFLIIAINSDASVKNLKGPGRPINSEADRALMLSAFQFVDFVTVFDEQLPNKTIEILKPDVHVKGGDYNLNDLPEKEVVQKYGGKIVIFPFLNGYSSTNIINKIQGE